MKKGIAKKILILGCKLAVSLALLAVALCAVRIDALAASLCGADEGWLAVAALFLVFGGFAGAASWFCILRLRLPTLRFRDAAVCHWIGMFFNSFLPSNVGGDVVKGWLVSRVVSGARPAGSMTRENGGRVGFIVVSLLLDRVVNLGMLLGIGCFALLLDRLGWLAATGFLGLCALAVGAAVAFSRRVRGAEHAQCADESEKHSHRWKLLLRSLAADLLALAGEPRRLFSLLLAAFASQLLKTGSNVFVVYALGLKIPLFCVWYVIPLFGAVSALPVSIGGLGVRELVAHAVAEPLRIGNAHLIALSLAGHLLTVLVNLLGAIPFLFRRYRRASGGS